MRAFYHDSFQYVFFVDSNPTIRKPGDHISVSRHNAINGLMMGLLPPMSSPLLVTHLLLESYTGERMKNGMEKAPD